MVENQPVGNSLAATDDCTTEDEKEHDAEEEVSTYCEDEDSDNSSYDQLIDDSME